MSQENVEIVRSMLDAWNRGDYSAALELVAPDIRAEDYALGGGLDATYEGIPGVQKWLARFWGSFVDFHTAIEECIPVDDEVVFAAHHYGRGKASGVEVEMRNWHVLTFRNGKVVRYRVFQTKPEALEAAGLREKAMSRKNVEIVRDFLGGRYPTAEIWDPNGDYYPVAKFPESRPCHGPAEIARFFRDFEQAWEHVEITIAATTPIGDDRVLVSAIVAGAGRESGLNLQSEIFYCFWLRHGRIFREEDHLTLGGALRALGLTGDSLEAAGLRE